MDTYSMVVSSDLKSREEHILHTDIKRDIEAIIPINNLRTNLKLCGEEFLFTHTKHPLYIEKSILIPDEYFNTSNIYIMINYYHRKLFNILNIISYINKFSRGVT